MSDFAKQAHLDGRVVLGPEVCNGTGQVYLDVPAVLFLTSAQAREVAAALANAADYADARRADLDA